MKERFNKIKILFYLLCWLMPAAMCYAQQTINWAKSLHRCDMVFDTLTTQWEEGAFTGNGLLGAMVYMKDSNALRIEIGRTDVADHRKEPMNELIGKARLPIGHFVLRPQGKILQNTARVDLWNAEIRGRITTTTGSIEWTCRTLWQTNVIWLQTKTSGNEQLYSWEWVAEQSVSTRISFPNQTAPAGYQANPPGQLKIVKSQPNTQYYHQPMIAGGSYSTAWTVKQTGIGNKNILISVGYSKNDDVSDGEALDNILQASALPNLEPLIAAHQQAWHSFYQKSYLSMPDAKLESFYWIQMYKLASASGKGKPLIDLMGPWFRATPWPAYWWNLNTQLTYSPLYTSNHLEIASVLPATINANTNNLIQNVPVAYRYNSLALGRAGGIGMNAPVTVDSDTLHKKNPMPELEMGNATWLLYYYWLQYRYSMDKKVLTTLFPLLKRSINYYLNVARKDSTGIYHLPYTASPEYPGGVTRDCNYDLSGLRWGLQTLLEADKILGAKDPLRMRWQEVLDHLVAYPTDTNGLRIGADVAFTVSHRHYSHLLMIYPYHLLNWEQPENRDLIKKSLAHWHSMPGSLQGYSFTGGASIYATMGQGGKAKDYLHTLINKFVKPNTMYLESGPVIETPLAAAASIQEMFLQSWGGKIRVFPALPDDWADATFKDLRAEGAFLISAVRKNKETKWVKIKAEADGTCIVQPNLKGIIKIKSNVAMKFIAKENNTYQINLKKGEEVILYSEESELKNKLKEVEWSNGVLNPFGKKIIRFNK